MGFARRLRRPHLRRDLLAAFPLDARDIVLALQVEPEPRVVAEIAAEAHRRLGGDRAAAVENVGDAVGGHAERDGEPVGTEAPGLQFHLEQAAGV
jgi:hypothetical protein